MTRAPLALRAVLFGAVVFVAGFALGALRVTFVAPHIGPLAAVAVELPIMLAIAWSIARPLFRGRSGPAHLLAAGLAAFATLMVIEFAVATALFGQSRAAFVAALATAPGSLGLAGQTALIVLPWLAARST